MAPALFTTLDATADVDCSSYPFPGASQFDPGVVGLNRHTAGRRALAHIGGVLGPDRRLFVDAVLLEHEVGTGRIALGDRQDREVRQGDVGVGPVLLQRGIVPVRDLSGQEEAGGVAGELERLGQAGDVVHEGHAGGSDRDESKGNVGGVVPTLESTYPVSLTA